MQVLFPAAAIVLVPVHWFLAAKSCILMRQRQTSSFEHERQCFTTPHPSYSSQLIYFPFLILLFVFNFDPHCWIPSFSTILSFSLLLLHILLLLHFFIVFPPPPYYFCFPSSSSSSSFPLFSLKKVKEAKIRPNRPNSNSNEEEERKQ